MHASRPRYGPGAGSAADLRSILELEVDGVEAEGDHIYLECGARFGTWEALQGHVAKLHSRTRMQVSPATANCV